MDVSSQDIENLFHGPIDRRSLNLEQKLWLASRQNDHGDSGWSLGKRFSLNRKVVNKYALLVRKGKRLMPKGGRPCLLDGSSIRKVADTCIQEGCTNKLVILDKLRLEYQFLVDLHHTNGVARRNRLSKRTIRRYAAKVLDLVNSASN